MCCDKGTFSFKERVLMKRFTKSEKPFPFFSCISDKLENERLLQDSTFLHPNSWITSILTSEMATSKVPHGNRLTKRSWKNSYSLQQTSMYWAYWTYHNSKHRTLYRAVTTGQIHTKASVIQESKELIHLILKDNSKKRLIGWIFRQTSENFYYKKVRVTGKLEPANSMCYRSVHCELVIEPW